MDKLTREELLVMLEQCRLGILKAQHDCDYAATQEQGFRERGFAARKRLEAEGEADGQEVELEDHVAQGFNQYGKASVAILEGNGFLWNGPGLDWRRGSWAVYLSQEGGWVSRWRGCITQGKHWGALVDAIAATEPPGV